MSNNSIQKDLPFRLSATDVDTKEDYDSVVVLAQAIDEKYLAGLAAKYLPILQNQQKVDNDYASGPFVTALDQDFPISRLVFSAVSPFTDYADIRNFSEAAEKGVKRALRAGSKRPLLILPSVKEGYKYADLASILGALESLYVPIEIREDVPNRAVKAESLTIANIPESEALPMLKLASAIECGRSICRDIGGSDPERMAAPNVADYVVEHFSGTDIKVKVTSDPQIIQKEFPLLAAVNRCAKGIDRHGARVIFLTYEPEGPIDTTLVLVGKGVTYDTGGADIKAGGVMAGMHRDKCGAAAVAGFFKTVDMLKPRGIRIIGAMAMVRNSVGSDCYVADEIITARSGSRIRIGNTDAEGRMAMGDVLCYLKEKYGKEINPHYFTIATLTGHACLAVGDGYTIVVDNGPAKKNGVSQKIQQGGDLVGDMVEISTMRREDIKFHKGKSEYEDLLQCNNLPSSRTARGHQSPSAFLLMASGLDKHGSASTFPIKYTHVDIAAAAGDMPDIPTAAPIAAFTASFLMDRI